MKHGAWGWDAVNMETMCRRNSNESSGAILGNIHHF